MKIPVVPRTTNIRNIGSTREKQKDSHQQSGKMKRLSITGATTAVSLAALAHTAASFQPVISLLPSSIQLENVSKKCEHACCFSFFDFCICLIHLRYLLRSRNVNADIVFECPKA